MIHKAASEVDDSLETSVLFISSGMEAADSNEVTRGPLFVEDDTSPLCYHIHTLC
jgi:hypothetical protein